MTTDGFDKWTISTSDLLVICTQRTSFTPSLFTALRRWSIWAITSYSDTGHVVLDPMMRSGPTLIEACLLGHSARGTLLIGKTVRIAGHPVISVTRFPGIARASAKRGRYRS